MRRKRVSNLLYVSAVGCVLLGGPLLLAGCGDAQDGGGQVTPEPAEQNEARNKSMEDYMNSPEGKKATKAAP
jgi:hypothetical protein